MRILADENIPLVLEAFGALGTVRLLPGRAMTRDDVRTADVLLVRSVTPVDKRLLEGSVVRFVGSATIGTDHVDTAYLRERGIAFAHAPGANADSVVEYVAAALLRLAATRGEALRGRTVGIVGCGNIGSRLARRLPALGLRVLKNDPPLAEAAEGAHDFVPLDEVLEEAGIVTLHVPLTRAGPHPTHHLFSAEELHRMRPGAWLLNTARGAVVDNEALRRTLAGGGLGAAVLDVWEDEPVPDARLVRQVALATPHIAGYSYDGKVQGTLMLYRALVNHVGLSPGWTPEDEEEAGQETSFLLDAPAAALPEAAWLGRLVRQMYDIAADDARLRRSLDQQPPSSRGASFSSLRKRYPRRYTFARYGVPEENVPQAYRPAVEEGLQVRLLPGA